jgi:hypothetical protein
MELYKVNMLHMSMLYYRKDNGLFLLENPTSWKGVAHAYDSELQYVLLLLRRYFWR